MPDKNSFAYGRNRLLVNSREHRYVPGVGVFAIAWIARAINVGLLQVQVRSCTRDDVAGMVAGVIPLDDANDQRRFALQTLHSPLLAYADPDGGLRLLDGRKRARQAFAEGQAEVLVCVISSDEAKLHGMDDELRVRYEVAEATKNHPIEVEGLEFYEATLVQLAIHPTRKGRPAGTEVQRRLDAYMYYYINALIDIEDFIRRNYTERCMMKGSRQGASKENWARAFFEYFKKELALCSLLSYDDIKNYASAAIREVTQLHGRPDFKRSSHQRWKTMSVDQLVEERTSSVRICKAVTRAAFRLTIWQESQRSLVSKEHRDLSMHYEEVRDDVYHLHPLPRVHDKNWIYEVSKQPLQDQLLATGVTGINANHIYFDAPTLDPLFEAYAFHHAFCQNRRAEIDLGMIETVVRRRDMMISGETDALSGEWEAVLDLWTRAGIADWDILGMADMCDRAELTRERMVIEFQLGPRRDAS